MNVMSYLRLDESEEHEFLDLKRHAAEEFEGKWISCHGRDYQVGEFLGAGHERRVHKLYNGLSKHCLHVLQVRHDQENAAAASRHMLKMLDIVNRKKVEHMRLPRRHHDRIFSRRLLCRRGPLY